MSLGPVLRSVGNYAFLVVDVIRDMMRGVNPKELAKQMTRIGAESMPIVALTAMFTGMVLALQTAYGLQRFGAKIYVGNIVSLALVRELGPVLTAVMLCGRVGAGVTAEVASMVATEQVDAMRALGADPIRKLVTPKIMAAVLVMPILVVFADIIGIAGGALVAVYELGITWYQYERSILYTVVIRDVIDGLIKGGVFGFIVGSIACYKGLTTRGGTEGVGTSTTEAVVTASLAILIADYFVTKLLILIP